MRSEEKTMTGGDCLKMIAFVLWALWSMGFLRFD